MPLLFLVQVQQGGPDAMRAFAFRPASLGDGDWWPGVLTTMFLHADWPHVTMNALGAIAFGPPVARLMPGVRGAAAFLLFYTVCGLVGAVGYGLVHLDSDAPVVGASGAVFGLMGAAIRLLGRPGRRLRALADRRVLTVSVVLMAVNAGAGLMGLAPGMDGAVVAWEAHAFGYLAGLLLIGPWTRLWGARREAFDSAPDLRDPSD